MTKASKPKASSPKTISKKHKARLERDQIQRKRILTVAGIILAIIVLVLIYGVLDQTILKAQKPVAKVGNEVIRSSKFIKQVKFQRYQLNQQALQYASFKQIFGDDPNNSSYIDSLIQQIQFQMENSESLGGIVLDNMINDILIANYARENNITVSDAEVTEKFQSDFNYYPSGTPTPENTVEVIPTSTLNPTQNAIITPVPTLEPTPTVDPGNITPTATASAPQATATPFTETAFTAEFNSMVERFKEIDFSEADLRDLMRSQLLGEKVREQVTKNVDREEEQVWARHILVGTLEEALAVKKRLNDGDDFAALAAELSLDTANKDRGGDLGWFGKGTMDPDFESAVFAMNIGEISAPVQTASGFHIIQLVGKEIRPLSPSQLEQKKQAAFTTWLAAEKEKTTIEKFDTVWKSIVPTEPAFPKELTQ
ncbi:MAG: hypothetical protein BGO78_16460 [Chloroflexi bacterium 44-23]|nr:MAG: hypothetical protein BGO78_16460 [Chloroflexi bacterium 44-23]